MFRIGRAIKQNGKRLEVKPKNQGVSVASGLMASDNILVSQRIYLKLLRYMEEVGSLVERGQRFDIRKGEKLVQTMFRAPEGVMAELKKIALLASGPDRLSTHSVNVTINVIQMGTILKYEYEEHVMLAMAALFHEIGMYTLPPSIREKKATFNEAELKTMQGHCEAGYQLIAQFGEEYEGVAEVIRQEHERFDGSGYPRGLKGYEIHEHASIIGIVDMYTSMVQDRPYRRRLLPADAMKEIVTNCKGWFSTHIMRKLLHQLSVYPVQSYIRLNNLSIGMVVKTDAMWPLKPTIKLICDAQGKKLTEETVIDLSENPLLYVKEVISEAETLDL